MRENSWQPIETAPKDNTLVLVADTEGNYCVRYGHAAANVTTDWKGDTHKYTHWMPLPDPPSGPEAR